MPGPTPWYDQTALEEQRALLLPFEFTQRHQNEWCLGAESLSDEATITAAAREGFADPVPGRRYVISVDLGWKHDHTGIAVLHAEPDPAGRRYLVDRVIRFKPPVVLGDVEELVRNWAAWYRATRLVFDPTQMQSMVERLKLPAVAFTGSPVQNNEAARVVYQGFRDGRISYPDAEGLQDDFLHMSIVEKGVGQVRIEFEHRGAEGHGDVGQAVVMGIWHLSRQPVSMTGHFGGLAMVRSTMPDVLERQGVA